MSDSIPKRRQAIPVIYTRGTNYEVGFDMGHTFSNMIQEFVQKNLFLNDILLPGYSTPDGKKLYDQTLAIVKLSFPQYVRELEGIAQGAQVEFHKLFLLHLGNMMPQYLKGTTSEDSQETTAMTGGFNIVVNNYYNRYIAHTEDVTPDMLNSIYLVIAHIENPSAEGKYKVLEESFTALCFAGHLPGFSMSSNQHGLAFSINKLRPSTVYSGRTPPHFLARALLCANSMEQVAVILADEGVGVADGFSLSIASINDRFRKCFVIEVAPSAANELKSKLEIGQVQAGSYAYHGNQYQSLEIEQSANMISNMSLSRLQVIAEYDAPRTKEKVLEIMNDERLFLVDEAQVKTALLGIIDLAEKTLSLYLTRPMDSGPILKISLNIKSDCRVYES